MITDNNDETGTTDKFLLLVDQLSLEQPQHLSIKDIGIILDRLSSKIIDVAILDREIEATDTHNWTIKVGTDQMFGSAKLLGRTSTVPFWFGWTVVAELLQFGLLQNFCFAEQAELISLLFIAGHYQGWSDEGAWSHIQ